MRLLSNVLLVIVLFLTCLGSSAALADTGEDPARLTVHLLDYLTADYGGAVENGKIKNEFEYKEQVEFAYKVIELNQELAVTKSDPTIAAQLEALKKLVLGKAEEKTVGNVAQDVKFKIIRLAKIPLAPTTVPDLTAGRKSFMQNCTSCHGDTGHGDGPSGKNLDPKPINFHDAERMDKLTAFQAFNAVRLGVPGTGMAGFPTMTDAEIWDVAFYVLSIRHQTKVALGVPPISRFSLQDLTTKSDEEILRSLPGETEAERHAELDRIRVEFSSMSRTSTASTLSFAREKLNELLQDVTAGRWEVAEKKALVAYLDGIEPVEPRLRARDPRLLTEVETRMGRVRKAIDLQRPSEEIGRLVIEATEIINECETALTNVPNSPWLTFSVAAGIFLREAFEAILLLIVLLGVIRSMGSRKATIAVHAGWMSAVAVGLLCWAFSGWVMAISGASREVMEGSIALFAVVVLLYMGFWLHRKTEIGRWRSFIEGMAKSALAGKKSLVGLWVIAFMAVFREAFEIVLFMRALLLESGAAGQWPMIGGILSSLVVVVALSVALLKFSTKLPLRQLFDISSMVMVFLAFTLVGKAIHSFQESGWLSITEFPLSIRIDLMGIFPTYETILAQAATLVLCLSFWFVGRRPSRVENPAY